MANFILTECHVLVCKLVAVENICVESLGSLDPMEDLETGVDIIPFLIPNRTRGYCVYVFTCIYTSEMCTAFGVLKDVNISNQYKRQIRIYRKINTSLQYYTFWNFVYYLQSYLHSYFQLFTTTTWLIFTPNITQSTFRMVLYGIIWSPALR